MQRQSGFKLGVVGDINLCDFPTDANPFRTIGEYLGTLNASVGTLEGLLAEPEELYYKPGFTHVGRGHGPSLADAGFKALNLASNVSYGGEAIRKTLEELDENGIAHTGAGMDRDGARSPVKITVDGVRIGIVSRTAVFWPYGHAATATQAGVVPVRVATSYKPHPRLIELPGAPAEVVTIPSEEDVAELQADIAALRADVDVLLVLFHFGVSLQRDVVDYQRSLARASIDAGADAVLGSHAHVIQPVEVYKNRPVFYGMAQVIFGWDFVAKVKCPGQLGLVVELEIAQDGEFKWSGRFVKPDADLHPRMLSVEEAAEEVTLLRKSSGDVLEFESDRFLVRTRQ